MWLNAFTGCPGDIRHLLEGMDLSVPPMDFRKKMFPSRYPGRWSRRAVPETFPASRLVRCSD